MRWPLAKKPQDFPTLPHHGAFAAIRKFDIHTGIDLYCEDGDKVFAVEDGTVVEIQPYTGEEVGSPWWNYTEAVLVEGKSGVICYGEILPADGIKIGQPVSSGDLIGSVKQVLKKDKGLPMSMLHFELYRHGTRDTVLWYLNEPQPESLLDPTDLLERILNMT